MPCTRERELCFTLLRSILRSSCKDVLLLINKRSGALKENISWLSTHENHKMENEKQRCHFHISLKGSFILCMSLFFPLFHMYFSFVFLKECLMRLLFLLSLFIGCFYGWVVDEVIIMANQEEKKKEIKRMGRKINYIYYSIINIIDGNYKCL